MGSVRGYPESAWGGDHGGYWRNEWAFKLPAPGGQLRYEPYLFLDGARLYTLADRRWRHLLGAGAGVRVAYARTSAELILGKPVRHSSGIAADTGWRIDLSASCAF
jgi:hemolysin activation/secretion protein